MSERDGHPDGGENEFGSRLQELKERGCAVLVTGEFASVAHPAICRQLLGATTKERRRILVLTDGRAGLDGRLPAGGRRADTELVLASEGRGTVAPATAAGAGDAVGTSAAVELGDARLDQLGVAVVDAGRRLEERYGPFEPAELRVGLDSLSPLLDAHPEEAVFKFLVVLLQYVRSRDGLGHVHLPVDRDASVARLLAPLFDAVAEVRDDRNGGQHRWHLDDGGLTSRWLPL